MNRNLGQDEGLGPATTAHQPVWLGAEAAGCTILAGVTGAGKAVPQPATSSRAAAHADRAHSALDRLAGADPGTTAITHALLAVVAVLEVAAERQAEDADTVAAMLDDRLTSIEGAIDAVTATPVPLYRRVRFRLRNRRARSRQPEAAHSSGWLRPGP